MSGMWLIILVLVIAFFAILVSLDGGRDAKKNARQSAKGRSGQKSNGLDNNHGPLVGGGGNTRAAEVDDDVALPPARPSALVVPPPDVQKIEAIPPVNR